MTITTRTYSRLISSFFKFQDLYREYSGSFDDDEDSDSYDAAVNSTRRQSRKALKELDLEIANEAY